MAQSGHCYYHAGAIVASCVFFILTAAFNGMATSGAGPFTNSTGDLADKWYVEATPAGWVFGVNWSLIYLWQAAFLLYSVTTIFRRTPDSTLVYRSDFGVPLPIFIIYMLNMLLNIGWLLLWDRGHIWPALVFIVAIQVTLYVMLFLIIKSFQFTTERYLENKWEFVMRILFAHNAIAIYGGWLTCAPLVNLAVCLSYGGPGLAQRDVSIAMLSILLVAVIVWFPIELTVFERRMRFTDMHYFPIIFAGAGIISKQNDAQNPNVILAALILTAILILFVVKCVLGVVYTHRDSRHSKPVSTSE